MRFTFSAPQITAPTFETLKSYGSKKLAKLSRLLPKDKMADYEVRVSVKKENQFFNMLVEIPNKENARVTSKGKDIRRCIDDVTTQLKRNLRKVKERRIDMSRVNRAIKFQKEEISYS